MMQEAQNTQDRLTLVERLKVSAEALTKHLAGHKPCIGVILGSGMAPLAEAVENKIVIPFDEVPYIKHPTALGQLGEFIAGELGGKEVLVLKGRLHTYEGYTAQDVAYPVWLMHEIGIPTLIDTCASGGVNPMLRPGDVCVITDQINFSWSSPLIGIDPDELAPRFVSMYEAFDPELTSLAYEVAQSLDIDLRSAVYYGNSGPAYETPAEVRAIASLGADCVAMSYVEEVIAARHVGMRVLGFTIITNMACGIQGSSPNGDEVIKQAAESGDKLCRVIEGVISKIRA